MRPNLIFFRGTLQNIMHVPRVHNAFIVLPHIRRNSLIEMRVSTLYRDFAVKLNGMYVKSNFKVGR